MLAQRLSLSLPTIKNVSPEGFDNLYSLDFDGVDDYVTMGDVANTEWNAPFSLSYWLKRTGVTGTTEFHICKQESSGNYRGWMTFISGSNDKLAFSIRNVNTAAQKITSQMSNAILDTDWHHAVFTYSGSGSNTGVLKYFDGVLDTGGTSIGDVSATIVSTAPLQFAKRSTGTPNAKVLLDEVAIFDAVLSAADVTAIYNSGSPTDLSGESDLVGYWRNGDTAGTSVYPTIEDYSSNSNDGTMTNMVSGDIVEDVP